MKVAELLTVIAIVMLLLATSCVKPAPPPTGVSSLAPPSPETPTTKEKPVLEEIELKYDDGVVDNVFLAGPDGGHIIQFSPPTVPFYVKEIKIFGVLMGTGWEGRDFEVQIWDKSQRVLWSGNYPFTLFPTATTTPQDWRTTIGWVELEVSNLEVNGEFCIHVWTNYSVRHPQPSGIAIGADLSSDNEHSDGTLGYQIEWPYPLSKDKVNWMIRVVGTGAEPTPSSVVSPATSTPPTTSPLPTEGFGWREISTPAGGESLRVQWIEVDAPGGYKLNAAVFRPTGEGPFPVVLVLHGTAGFVLRTAVLGEVLAKAGFLTIAGAWFSGSGEGSAASPTPIASPDGPPFNGANLDSIKYVKALVNAAKVLPGADSGHIGLFGISRGAIAALLVASTDGVQAVVADSGSGEVAAIAIDTSPLDVVETLTVPILILHGTADQTVPVESIRKYERVLKQWGKTYEVYYYEGAGHAVTQQHETRVDARKRTVDFFTKHLTPASPSQ